MPILQIDERDVPEVAALEATVWGEAAADAGQIRSRAATFPEGSFIARLPDGKLAGYVVVQRVDQISTGSWVDQTDDGRIAATHRPDGQLVYGVNLSVLPEGAKYGISRALLERCFDGLVTNGPCSAMCLGSRLPGFARWAGNNGRDIRAYLSSGQGNSTRDPELRIYERNGFRLLWEMEEYFADPESLNYGAMVVRR